MFEASLQARKDIDAVLTPEQREQSGRFGPPALAQSRREAALKGQPHEQLDGDMFCRAGCASVAALLSATRWEHDGGYRAEQVRLASGSTGEAAGSPP